MLFTGRYSTVRVVVAQAANVDEREQRQMKLTVKNVARFVTEQCVRRGEDLECIDASGAECDRRDDGRRFGDCARGKLHHERR